MRKSKLNKILFILILFTLLLLMMTIKSNASSLSISTSKSSVSPGETFTVTVSVSGGAGYVNLSASNANLSSASLDLMLQSSATVNCTAGSSGTITIYASGVIADYTTEQDENKSASKTVTIISNSNPSGGTPSGSSSGGSTGTNPSSGGTTTRKPSNNGTTTTNPEVKKSNDSTLRVLSIEGQELSPAFTPENKEYSVIVTNDITSVPINAVVNDSKANYKLEGDYDNLQVGNNVIHVIVTAEDGTTSDYVLNVTRQREGLNVLSIAISYIDEEGNRHDLNLKPELSAEVFEYTLDDLSYLISKLNVEVLTNLEGTVIEVTGNENLVEGKNVITITVIMPAENEEEVDEVLTYTITVNKEKQPVVTLMGKIENWFSGITGTITTWYQENLYEIIMGALTFCIIALAGLSIYFAVDFKKYKLIVTKVAEITKMNNANISTVNEAADTNIEQQTQEEPQTDSTQPEEKNKGRHF